MTRASNSPVTRRRRKKIISKAKGYIGCKRKLFKAANEQLMRSWVYSYRDRKQKKRNFRKLWIVRINNALKNLPGEEKISYSKFINNLRLSQIHLNRFQLSEMAINNEKSFLSLVEQTKKNYLSTKG